MSILETSPWVGESEGLESPYDVVARLANRPDLWGPLVRFDPENRVHVRAFATETWEAWVLTWLPGQGTVIHNHGGSAGAFVVVEGGLRERTYGLPLGEQQGPVVRDLGAGQIRAFSARHIHRVTNITDVPTISVHAYAPAIRSMTTFSVDEGRLVETGIERAGADW
jgi:predicted metal-dependent enzyme (double-stranded beta helix superfamily)